MTAYQHRAKCLECSTAFSAKAPNQRFCSTRCKQDSNNRAKAEGAAIIHLAKAWRAARGHDKRGIFGELCSTLDEFNRRDRIEGRAPASDHIQEGERYIDRARPGQRREATRKDPQSPATDPDQELLFPELPGTPGQP